MKTQVMLAAAAVALAGCAPLAIGAGGGIVAHSVVQERSTMDALNDNVIEFEIAKALLNHSGRLFRNVAVKVVEGRVVLTGSVPRPEDKVAATRIAWETEGVTAVADELTVGGGGGAKGYLRDARMSTMVRLSLLRDAKVRLANYNVETVDGVVYLTGLARSEAELERVVWHARRVDGVKRVVSHVLTIDDPRRAQTVAATG
ncbi:MAG TPA: BON domain-containing protein [Thermohalobaculum sp.]|nr:BON domain-containing protein [Thermohalobaculum sp.]